MSQVPHETLYVPNAGGGHQYPPQSAQNQPLHGVPSFVDGSGPIFSMYLEMATEEDKKMAENWKADADGILIFTGLFSAAVASLISVSIQDIQQNPQDTSNFYLANIYQTLADPNISTSLPTSPPSFSPPTSAVWVNALWFLSLVISLTCALLATLLQQWARRYLTATQSRYSLHKRARIRAFLAEGVEKRLLPWTVETLPTLLHISLFLFFAGLVVFLSNINLTIFKLVLSWVGACTALYGCITVMPSFHYDSPYHTPLSLPAWHIITGISFLTFRALRGLTRLEYFQEYFSWQTRDRFHELAGSYRKWLVQGMQKTVEETALKSSSGIDARAFLWTFECLDEDHELERFFSGLPGFCSSKEVENPLRNLAEERKEVLFAALIGLLDRTFSSDLLPEPVKYWRAIICTKALGQAYDQAHRTEAFRAVDRILSKYPYCVPLVPEIVQIVRDWDNTSGGEDVTVARVAWQATISTIVARVQSRNDSWFILASRELGVSKDVLRDYAAHGNNLYLAILIHISSQQFSHYWQSSWPSARFSAVLEAAAKSDVQDASPELRHRFCELWNEIVRRVRDDNSSMMAFDILGRIRNVYVTLHHGTDSAPTQFSASTGDRDDILQLPSSYPVCNGHRLDLPYLTPDTHNDPACTTFAHTAQRDYDNNAPFPSFRVSSPDTPPLSAHSPVRVDDSFTNTLPLDNNLFDPVSLHPADKTTIESRRISASSPNPVLTYATTHRSSARTMHLSTPEPLASTSAPKSSVSTSPPDTAAVEHTADTRAPSDDPDVSLLASPTPVLEDTFPIETHSTMLVPASSAPFTSPLPSTSARDLGAVAEDEGCPTAGLRKDKDALPTSLTIRENVVTVLERPVQSSLPSSVTGVAIAGPSGGSPGAENTGDRPPSLQRSRSPG